VRGWDFADSTGGDFTAGGKLGKLKDGRYIIGGMEREQFTTDARDRLILNTASRDGARVRVSIPQDPGQAGKGQVLAMTRMLSGYPVKSSPESGDKVVRAEAFASQVNVGNVLMLRGAWNDALIEEMKLFPNGAYDDQVDSLSRAFNELLGVADPSPAGVQVQGL
jgi:predicted phage terminase large subunit-like protein